MHACQVGWTHRTYMTCDSHTLGRLTLTLTLTHTHSLSHRKTALARRMGGMTVPLHPKCMARETP
eukprot:366426-Chlamydomonas_euryale.AAC.30